MLRSFADDRTEDVWSRRRVAKFGADLQKAAYRKLLILDAADTLRDCNTPPGNRLEKLSGDRTEQYSIRINDQFRICFNWTDGGPENIEITDYH